MPDIGWVSLVDSTAYFVNRYGADAWATMTDAIRTKLY